MLSAIPSTSKTLLSECGSVGRGGDLTKPDLTAATFNSSNAVFAPFTTPPTPVATSAAFDGSNKKSQNEASTHFPGGVTPCHPGCVIPLPGSVVTLSPSAETVAVP